eukprot:CAMPEP_0178375516 /NCGR_PEP_ID=MMETSP0689_2-20121128/2927_1 /TAXON_ID=160604 /ORGANISM="Amphidinium massartii, Strain CS-259" /LENGTH=663 /DNA_ID=CAMNT_0019995509 /DNA_START=8 /DNA_END=1999 /DNA_ORIENTATION=-
MYHSASSTAPAVKSGSLAAPLLAEKDEEYGQLEREHSPQAPEGARESESLGTGLLAYSPAGMMRRAVLLWFRTTTNRDYLQSPISRRRWWKWFWPTITTLALVSDAAAVVAGSGAWSTVCGDAAFLLITLLVCVRYTLQLTTIRADLVLGLSFLANVAWWMLQLSLAKDGLITLDAGSLSMVILFFCCLGVHSSISLLTLVCGIISKICFAASEWEDIMYCILELMISSAAAVILEFCIASLYQDLQAKAACNQQLLDFATDGFGAVQTVSWRLTQASHKMAETFGRPEEELVGCGLDALVDDRDRGSVRTFLEEAAKGSAASALLVTASSRGWQFEVRLMPYKVNHDGAEIGFCMQLVGEMRAIETTSPAAQCGSLAAAGHQEGQPCPSDAEGEAMLACQSSADEQQPQELRCTAPSSSFVQQAEAMEASRPSRPLGTLSFSSWTISAPSVKDFNMRLKKKEMMTQATQTGETQRRRKPPAPLAAATGNLQCAAWQPGGGRGTGRQPKSRHRGTSSSGRQQGRLPDVRIEEGRPVLSRFSPTPRSTRGNCLNGLVKSFNITGPGCCSKHVGYMALYDVLLEELTGSCGNLTLNSDWQCPDCLSLSKWQEDVDSASDDDSGSAGLEQFCMMCGTVVENPILRAAIATAFQSSSSVEASASSVG